MEPLQVFKEAIRQALESNEPNPWTVSVRIQTALQDYERALLRAEKPQVNNYPCNNAMCQLSGFHTASCLESRSLSDRKEDKL